MAIIIGIGWLILLCSLIVLLASAAISQQTKNRETKETKDPFAYLFDVYDE